ncbi:hypothetical protein ACFW6Q_26890 [Streptomyces sp. NPDC058737]|uniref:hypothetical protein n=1 Tax=Streptomyces sp. NPDC058737 TaxID=3346617 RepID=UPI0036CCC811
MRALEDALSCPVEFPTDVLEAAAERLPRSLELRVRPDHALCQPEEPPAAGGPEPVAHS